MILQDDNKAVVLLSGGLDSATALAIAKNAGFACHCLSFDYGQRHMLELAAAAKITGHLGGVDHRIVKIDLSKDGGFGSSALTDDIPVPKQCQPDGEIPITYVPARNTIFLSIALGYAEVIGAFDIFIGVTMVDYSGYPDCRQEFITAFESMANLATIATVKGEQKLKIHAPLIAMSKAEIITTGTDLGVDYSLMHSCYDPTDKGLACGKCDSCRFRRAGFEEAGVPDPTKYSYQ